MVLPASSVLLLPTVSNGPKVTDQIYSGAAVDLCAVIENLQETSTMASQESQEKEKQISVDPISLKELPARDESTNLVLPPAIAAPKLSFIGVGLSVSPSPAKPKLLSFSLPNSATSSPRFSTSILKKRWGNQGQASPTGLAERNLNRCDSPVLSHRESRLRRSKSCGEGRASAPSDEFDLWLNGPTIDKRNEDRVSADLAKTRTEGSKDERRRAKEVDPREDGFKCGPLCFLPGFGRVKSVRARKEEAEATNVISRTVSLEKFECASWASSGIVTSNFEEDGDSMNLYFDLPLELIRTSVNEANSPVSAAFVFDKNMKGVLKNSSGREVAAARKSQESSRHVRFSTSSPTSYPGSPSSCITPRLRKAREDFNAYLEAQS